MCQVKPNPFSLPGRQGSLVDVCQLDPGFPLDFGVGHHLVLDSGVAALDQIPTECHIPLPPFVGREGLTEVDDETLHVAIGIWPLGWANALSKKVPG